MNRVRLNEDVLRSIIRESIKNYLSEAEGDGIQRDEYGNPIPRFGQGWKYSEEDKNDPTMRNRQGYEANGSKGPWFSRSCAMATAVILKDEKRNHLYILAGQRGTGTPDFQGYWNLPCGYLDYHETTKEGAAREVYEETGIRLDPSQLIEFGHSSDPSQNRQNVCFFYGAVVGGCMEDYHFSLANMEENEVGGLQWVDADNVDDVMWAFGHKALIKEMLSKLSYSLGRNEEYGVYSLIDQAIDLVRSGGNADEIISVLENAKEQLNNN